SAFQAFGIAMYLEGLNNQEMGGGKYGDVVAHPGWLFRIMTIITLTTGTAFIMWVGEQITERGISNGISLIIMAGIVTDIPSPIGNSLAQTKANTQRLNMGAGPGLILMTIATIVFFERGQRKIPITSSRRNVGRRVYGGQTAPLPLKVNTAGTIPP